MTYPLCFFSFQPAIDSLKGCLLERGAYREGGTVRERGRRGCLLERGLDREGCLIELLRYVIFKQYLKLLEVQCHSCKVQSSKKRIYNLKMIKPDTMKETIRSRG